MIHLDYILNTIQKQLYSVKDTAIIQFSCRLYLQGGPQKLAHFLYALTLSNINWFTKLFHCQNLTKICNSNITEIPPHLKCVTTLPCEMLSVFKVNWKQDDFVTTHFKKLTTGNNVFSVSVIVYCNCHILQFLREMFNVMPCCWTMHSSWRRHWPVIIETLRQFAPLSDISQGSVATHLVSWDL